MVVNERDGHGIWVGELSASSGTTTVTVDSVDALTVAVSGSGTYTWVDEFSNAWWKIVEKENKKKADKGKKNKGDPNNLRSKMNSKNKLKWM